MNRYPHNSLIGLGIMLTGLPAYLFWRIRTANRGSLNRDSLNRG
jgi:hypothetical protein